MTTTERRKRGRPPGARNKPKLMEEAAGGEQREPELEEEDRDEDVQEREPSVAEIVARGAITNHDHALNTRIETALKARRAGKRSTIPSAPSDIVYEQIADWFSGLRVRIGIKKTHPEEHEYERVLLATYPKYEDLQRYISENCWNGERAAFRWTAYDQKGKFIYSGDVSKTENPEQIAKYRARVATLIAPQQPAVAVAAQAVEVASAGPSAAEVAMQRRLSDLEALLRREKEEDDEDEPNGAGEDSDPPASFRGVTVPQDKPAEQAWESVTTSDGRTAWVKKQPAPAVPPAFFPSPPAGFAYLKDEAGEWQCAPIRSAAPTPTAPPPPAPPAPPPPQPAPSPFSASQNVFSQQSLELLEAKHRLEVEIEVMKAKQKAAEDQRKRLESDFMTAAVPAQTTPALPAPPHGFAWTQDQAGKWMLVSIMPQQFASPSTVAPPVAAPAASPSIRGMVRELSGAVKELQEAQTLFSGNVSGGGFFPKAGEAAALAAGKKEEEPDILKPIEIGGGLNYWVNTDERKPVDGFTQAAMNLPALLNNLSGVVKEGIAEWKKAEGEKAVAKEDRDKKVMIEALTAQKEALDRTQRQLSYVMRAQNEAAEQREEAQRAEARRAQTAWRVQAARLEAAQRETEARIAEEARQAEEQRAEEARVEEERRAEAVQQTDALRLVEEARQAEDAQCAEAAQQADAPQDAVSDTQSAVTSTPTSVLDLVRAAASSSVNGSSDT